MFSFLPREGSKERWRARRALPQPLLEIQRQLVHGMALNWLHSGTLGPILSDETDVQFPHSGEHCKGRDSHLRGGRKV